MSTKEVERSWKQEATDQEIVLTYRFEEDSELDLLYMLTCKANQIYHYVIEKEYYKEFPKDVSELQKATVETLELLGKSDLNWFESTMFSQIIEALKDSFDPADKESTAINTGNGLKAFSALACIRTILYGLLDDLMYPPTKLTVRKAVNKHE